MTLRFEYAVPTSVEELVNLKGEGAVPFSGGTDLFVKMRLGKLSPKILVDTKKVDLPKWEDGDEYVTFYMNTTYSDVLEADFEGLPILKRVLSQVGSPQIRNRGTLVGNIVNASPAGDFLLLSYLHDAQVLIAPEMKWVNIASFVEGPGKVKLQEDEIVLAVRLRKVKGHVGYYEKVGKRNSLVIAVASIGILLEIEGDEILSMRMAFGSLGPTVLRWKDLEESVVGQKVSRSFVFELANEVEKRVSPISDVRASAQYRKKLSGNLVIKAFHELGLLSFS